MTNLLADLTQRKAVTFLRILYPIWFVLGLFSIMYVPSTLIVSGDAAATANNIMANEMLFRLGIVGSLLVQIIQILVVLLLYKLLKPVNKNMAVLMVVFALVGIPISMLNTLNRVATLLLVNGADYLKVFGADQLDALVMLFLNLNEQGVIIATVFWGPLAPSPRLFSLQVGLFSQNFGRLVDNWGFWLSTRFFYAFSFTQPRRLRNNIFPGNHPPDIWGNIIYGLGCVERC